MNEKKKIKFLSKSVRFNNKELVLYSIDGTTWSTRKQELTVIMERHEAERQKLLASMGDQKLEGGEGLVAEDESKEEREESPSEGPLVISQDEEIDISEEGDEEELDDEEPSAKARNARSATPAVAKARTAAKEVAAVKAKKKKKQKLPFVSPKPRQIAARQKKKAAKGKKKAA